MVGAGLACPVLVTLLRRSAEEVGVGEENVFISREATLRIGFLGNEDDNGREKRGT
jgi:hypothetical protein